MLRLLDIAVCSLDYFHSQCTQQNNLIVLQRQRRFGTAADAAFAASLGYIGELPLHSPSAYISLRQVIRFTIRFAIRFAFARSSGADLVNRG